MTKIVCVIIIHQRQKFRQTVTVCLRRYYKSPAPLVSPVRAKFAFCSPARRQRGKALWAGRLAARCCQLRGDARNSVSDYTTDYRSPHRPPYERRLHTSLLLLRSILRLCSSAGVARRQFRWVYKLREIYIRKTGIRTSISGSCRAQSGRRTMMTQKSGCSFYRRRQTNCQPINQSVPCHCRWIHGTMSSVRWVDPTERM